MSDLIEQIQHLKEALRRLYENYAGMSGDGQRRDYAKVANSHVTQWIYTANVDHPINLNDSNVNVFAMISVEQIQRYLRDTLHVEPPQRILEVLRRNYDRIQRPEPLIRNEFIERAQIPQLLKDVYTALDVSSNLHLGVPPRVVQNNFDVELFGTELNTTVNFCAPFTASLGNKNEYGGECVGSFFSYSLECGKRYLANPPFDDNITYRMAERLQVLPSGTLVVVIFSIQDQRSAALLRQNAHFMGEMTPDSNKLPFYSYILQREITGINTRIIQLGGESGFLEQFVAGWIGVETFPLLFSWPLIRKQIIASWESVDSSTIHLSNSPDLPEKESGAIPMYGQSLISTLNTAFYLFHGLRSGVLVQVRRGTVSGIRFFNPEFQAPWGGRIVQQLHPHSDPDIAAARYYQTIDDHSSRINPDPSTWWLNGYVIDNQASLDGFSDHLLEPTLDLIRSSVTKDDTFDLFINKRDHPQLRPGLREVYNFVAPEVTGRVMNWISSVASITTGGYSPEFTFPGPLYSKPVHPEQNVFTMTPIASFFTDTEFLDLPWPTADDINNSEPVTTVPWEEREDRIIFRGSATGGGITIEQNQRLRAAWIAAQLSKRRTSPQLQIALDLGISARRSENQIGATPSNSLDLIGAWNLRDKKLIDTQPMNRLDPRRSFPDKISSAELLKPFMTMEEQQKARYALYVNGHVAAARYSTLMRYGFCILKVASIPRLAGKELWFFKHLTGFHVSRDDRHTEISMNSQDVRTTQEHPIEADHFIIDSDFGNLGTTLDYLATHSWAGQRVAENSLRFHREQLSRAGLERYVREIFTKLQGR
jgi:hypothetical protein